MPAAKAANSKTPIGPFQKTVRGVGELRGEQRTVAGPISRPSRSAGIFGRDDDVRGVRPRSASARRYRRAAPGRPRAFRLGDHSLTDVDLILLEQRVADLVALRRQEGVRHAAADQQPVDLVEQVRDHSRACPRPSSRRARRRTAARDRRSAGAAPRPPRRPGRRPRAAAAAGGRRRSRACGARLRTRHRRRASPNAASWLANSPRSASSLLVSPARTGGSRAARRRRRLSPRRPPCGVRPTTSSAKATGRPSNSRAEPRPAVATTRGSRSGTLGPAEVRHHDDAGAPAEQLADGRHAGPDAAVVGDRGSPPASPAAR